MYVLQDTHIKQFEEAVNWSPYIQVSSYTWVASERNWAAPGGSGIATRSLRRGDTVRGGGCGGAITGSRSI